MASVCMRDGRGISWTGPSLIPAWSYTTDEGYPGQVQVSSPHGYTMRVDALRPATDHERGRDGVGGGDRGTGPRCNIWVLI